MKIEIDLHTHTMANDHAYSTLYENLQGAKERGLKGIAITDHGPNMVDSPHIWHFCCLKDLPKSAYGIRILRGMEANILNEEGELDAQPSVVDRLDFIIASYHPPVYNPKTATELENAYLNALDNPYVKILGHLDRDLEVNYDKIIKKAKEKNIAIELNKHSLELREHYKERVVKIAKSCQKYNATVVVNSDAHFCSEVGNVNNVFELLEEINFDKSLILNSSMKKTLEFLNVKGDE